MSVSSNTLTEVGYWEAIYEKYHKSFYDLLKRKAVYLKQLKDEDLFSLSEKEALRTNKRIKYLEQELDILWSYQDMIEQLRHAYYSSTLAIKDALEVNLASQNQQLLLKNHRLSQTIMDLLEIHKSTSDDLELVKKIVFDKTENYE